MTAAAAAAEDSAPANQNQLENIKVAVRLRPFTEKERQRNSQRIVDIEQNTVALYSPRQSDPTSAKKFTFDYSYWSHDGFKRDASGLNVPDDGHPNGDKYVGQAQVFEDLGSFLLSNALSGYNSALLAYGQTGSGKSYTVSGYGRNEGILPRFARALFEELDKRAKVLQRQSSDESATKGDADQSVVEAADPAVVAGEVGEANKLPEATGAEESENNNNRYEVCFSMIEIYNEVVRDLLAKNHGLLMSSQSSTLARRGLKVREHPKRGFFVENLTSYSCANKDEIERRIEEGHLNKSIAATSMNETSSRGHTIYEFKIKLYRLKSKDNPEETLTTSVVQLVDLAGSERMAVHVTGGAGGESFVGSRSGSPFPGGKTLTSASGASTSGGGGSSGTGKAQDSATRFTRSSRSVRVPTSASSTSSTAQQSVVGGQSVRRNAQANSMSLYNNQQQRFKESVSINQSLSALGNCIQVLSQYSQQLENGNQAARKQRPKIPYRDSVLTKLLNTCCLSGNSKVVIIATLSPADANYDDTHSTLRFADRAKQIRTHAVVNRMSRGQIVDALQRENERLKQMIDGRVTRSDDSSQTSNFDDSENMLENFHGPRAGQKSGGRGGGTAERQGGSVEGIATPTRGRTVKRSQADQARKGKRTGSQATGRLTGATSNPSLAVDSEAMQRLVSPASRLLAEANKTSGKANASRRLPKSRSMANGLSSGTNLMGNHEDDDDDDDELIDEAGLLDERELGDIKEGLISSDSDEDEESFGAIEVEGLSDVDKIGLFNKLLSNSKIASRLELQSEQQQQQYQQTKNRNKMQRPKRTGKRSHKEGGIQSVSVLSNSLKKTNPYLSNLNPDEQLTGMISYIIKQGETIIGKSDECDIVLHGAELRARHAKVTRISAGKDNNNNNNNKKPEEGQVVYIEPILADQQQDKQKASVALMLNGAPVLERTKLNHCDRLLFGSNIYFVFIDNVNSLSQANGDTLANLDMVTFDMARNEVLRKFMSEAKNEAVIREINTYVHRPGTGKHKSRLENATGHSPVGEPSKSGASSRNESSNSTNDGKRNLKLARSITVQDHEDNRPGESPIESPDSGGQPTKRKSEVQMAEENYRDKLMEDTYEFTLPVAEVNAVAKEMGIKVTYGLKILTGEEQLPEQADFQDSNTSDGFSSSSHGDGSEPANGNAANGTNESDANTKTNTKTNTSPADDQVTVLQKLDSLDIPPALFVQVHLEEQNIDFYWSKEKFQARRFKILELYGSWDVGGKSGLVEYLIDQSRNPNEYLIDPFVDDPAATLVLIGHAQITLQPISHLSDINQSYDVLNFNDELVGSVQVQAIPCHTERLGGANSREPYRVYSDNDVEKRLLHDPKKLLGKKLVFRLKIISCNNIPERYSNIFCQYTLNRDKPTIRTHSMREDSIELESSHSADQQQQQQQAKGSGDSASDGLSFDHSHFICFERVDQDTLDFLEHGFLTIQVVGQYKFSEQVNKSPSVITTIIKSINKYKYKLDQQSSYNSYSGSVYDNSNTDSAKSRRGGQGSTSGVNNSGASSVVSTSATVNLFDQQNEDDENINGLSQENIIDMILTKRKLDRAENQLHYLKRTINIAEHYNKKHIPVKTVKKLLSSYGHELDSGGLEEMAADVAEKSKSQGNKNSGCSIQ